MNNTRTFSLAQCVIRLLTVNGIDPKMVENSVKADMGQCQADKITPKAGAIRTKDKSGLARFTETVSTQYIGKNTLPLEFGDFSDRLRAAEKRFGDQIELASLPKKWEGWLKSDGFKAKAEAKEAKA